MIRRWLIPITGFRQDFHGPTGMEVLWGSLRQYSGPETCIVTPRQWDDDWGGFASFLFRNTEPHASVIVAAFSWGAGWGLVRLADALRDLPTPIVVQCAVLCDPVYRSPWLPTWLPTNPLSLLDGPTITVPANVIHVRWTRQRENRPAGHDLEREDGSVRGIDKPIERQLEHEQMDEDEVYHGLVHHEVRTRWGFGDSDQRKD